MNGVPNMAKNKQIMTDQNNDLLWETVSEVIDELQFFVNKAGSSTELIQMLLEERIILRPILKNKEELSVVYCEYGTQNYELIIDAGKKADKETAQTGRFTTNNPAIKDVTSKTYLPEEYPWFKNTAECERAGFSGFGTVMILPMHLDKHRRLGAFILHRKEENAFNETIRRVIDVLSDRMAGLIRSLRRRLRYELTYDLRNELLNRLISTDESWAVKREYEILSRVLDHLKEWYDYDKIHILIKNPLNTDAYFQAINEEGGIRENFRTTEEVGPEELLKITGSRENLQRMKAEPDGSSRGGPIKARGAVLSPAKLPNLPAGCKSWLGVTIHHPDGYVFGHIILHDTRMVHAYDSDDVRFMDTIADFLGFLLAEFRSRQKKAAMRRIFSLPVNQPEPLYKTVADYLLRFYGVKDLRIWAIQASSQQWKQLWPVIPTEEDYLHDVQNNFRDKITNFAYQHRIREGYNKKPLELSFDGKNYLITPIRAGTDEGNWRVIGAFIIPAAKPGKVASGVIDEVSDALGRQLQKRRNQRRNDNLISFINKVSSLPSKNLTQEKVLRIAFEHISKVMFSKNIYIALYDDEKDMISFPLIYRNGEVWGEMHNVKRKIDPTQLGRTEAIIKNEEKILIKTKVESREWYNQPGHKEYAGNPLASWVGVPIFTDSGEEKRKIRGVIAAYHDELDYVYSERDVFFLQNVAGAVSGLFRLLELEDSNYKLKKAQTKIAEQQHVLSTALLSQDLTHRLNNTIGATSINVDQAIRDIRYVRDSGDFSIFDFTTEALRDVKTILQDLVKEIQNISSDNRQEIKIAELIEKVTKQVSIAHRLKDKGIVIHSNISDNIPTIIGHYRTLFNAFTSLLENAIHAVSDGKNKGVTSPKINVTVTTDGVNVEVSISDNGVAIPPEIEAKLFEYGISSKGSSGFGLWRAKTVAENIGGNLTFTKQGGQKAFIFELPCSTDASTKTDDRKVAYILDDERSWRNILARWLSETGYFVQSASNSEEMLQLLESGKRQPDCVLLDISLDKEDGANYDGLALISQIKEKYPTSKVIIVSGYAHAAEAYTDGVAAVFPKIDEGGEILSKKKLISVIDY